LNASFRAGAAARISRHRRWLGRQSGVLRMTQAIVDPAELRRFAQNLKRFNEDLQSNMKALHGQMVGLSSSWRDREHDKFVEEFEQTLQVISRFVDASNQHVPFLLRKAERIDDYLQQR
jgi:uncharacterized protein YukE